jgi:hypothetical protein
VQFSIQAGLVGLLVTAGLLITVGTAAYGSVADLENFRSTKAAHAWAIEGLSPFDDVGVVAGETLAPTNVNAADYIAGFDATSTVNANGLIQWWRGSGPNNTAPQDVIGGNSPVSGYHGPQTRSRAMAFHQSGVYVGTVVGTGLGAWIAEHYGWRLGFYIFGAIGIVLGITLYRYLREPQRGAADDSLGFSPGSPSGVERLSITDTFRDIGRTPAAMLLGSFCLAPSFKWSARVRTTGGRTTANCCAMAWQVSRQFESRPSVAGYEIQILDDHGSASTPGATCSLYRYVAPCVVATRPAGDWNQLVIKCRGSRIQIVLNGQVVQDLDQTTIDAIKNKPLSGYFMLQCHTNPVEFRDVQLRQLKPMKEEPSRTESSADDKTKSAGQQLAS